MDDRQKFVEMVYDELIGQLGGVEIHEVKIDMSNPKEVLVGAFFLGSYYNTLANEIESQMNSFETNGEALH